MTILNSLKLLSVLYAAIILTWGVVNVIAQESPSGNKILSVSQGQSPIIELVNQINNGTTYAVLVKDTYAYIGVYGHLDIVDIGKPTEPFLVGTLPISWATPAKFSLQEDYLYASAGGDFYIIDVSNPLSPTQEGFHPTLGYSTDFSLVGDVAYVSHFNYSVPPGSPTPPPNGLTIIGVATPTTPTVLGSYAIQERGLAVEVQNQIAYLTDIGGQMHIVDISNPNIPAEISSYHVNTMPHDLEKRGHYVYVGGGFGFGNFSTLDVSNLAFPNEITSTFLLNSVNYISLAQQYAYLAAGSSLYVFDISNSANPKMLTDYNTPGSAQSVAVDNNYIYVADYNSGLSILRTLQTKDSTNISTQTGGTLISSGFSGSSTSLTFSSGVFTDTVSLTYRHLWLDQNVGDLIGIGRTFELETVYTSTNESAYLISGQRYTITAEYSDLERGPAIEDTLALYYWQGDHWEKEISSIVDPINNIIVATPNHLSSLWAILGETRKTFLPIVSK